MLQNLHVLSHLLFALNLLIEVLFAHAFDRNEVTTKFVLSDADFAESTFSKFVTYSIEFVGGSNRLTHLLEVRDNHGYQILLILEKRVKHFSHGNLWLVIFAALLTHFYLLFSVAQLRVNLSICVTQIL